MIDSSRIHSHAEAQTTTYRLPKYSPFLNLAEPINRLHKANIKRLQAKHIQSFLTQLKSTPRGHIKQTQIQMLMFFAEQAWCEISDDTPQKCWKFLVSKYFERCLQKMEIMN